MELKNLTELFREWNTPEILDQGTPDEILLDSLYDFTFKVEDSKIIMYDRNEYFNINVDEEVAAICYSASKEFGMKYQQPESLIEEKFSSIKKALKKDLDKEMVIEWEDGVVFSVYF